MTGARLDFQALVLYLKRVWFANGIHHQYSSEKFAPGFDFAALARMVEGTPAGRFPVRPGQSVDELLAELEPVIFDPAVDAKLVSKSAASDVVASSAVNFYGRGLTQPDVAAFYAGRLSPDDPEPVSLGLNSTLEQSGAGPVERVWKVGGRYTEAIEQVVLWLEKACAVAENDAQRVALEKLVRFYRSGDLRDWDEYNIAWLADKDSLVDAINGFIEVYHDPLGMRASFQSVVSFRDAVATKRIEAIAQRGAVVRRSLADSRSPQEGRRQRHHGQGDHGGDRSGRHLAHDADRHQPAEFRLDPHTARLEVREPRQHHRGLRRGTRRRRSRVRLGRGGRGAWSALRGARVGAATPTCMR